MLENPIAACPLVHGDKIAGDHRCSVYACAHRVFLLPTWIIIFVDGFRAIYLCSLPFTEEAEIGGLEPCSAGPSYRACILSAASQLGQR